MPRTPARVTQAEIDRALKAAQKAGARELVIEAAGVKLNFILTVDGGDKPIAKVDRKPRTLL